MGNPTYITQSSTGSSPWFSCNYQGLAPFNIGVAVRGTAGSTGWQVDVTLDDPFGTFPPPQGSSSPTVFLSSQVGTLSIGSSTGGVGAITTPIAALRLTNNSTAGGATLTVLQSGIG